MTKSQCIGTVGALLESDNSAMAMHRYCMPMPEDRPCHYKGPAPRQRFL